MTQKSFLPINRKIIRDSKKLLHSFVEMRKFYLNMQYSRKLVTFWAGAHFLNFGFWSIVYSKNINLKFSLYNIFLHIMLNSNMYGHRNSIYNFFSWSLLYLVTDGRTDINGFVMYSSRYVENFTQIVKLEDEHGNIMPSHYMGKS